MYTEQPLAKYIEDLSAKLPAPGGGSAAALTGALAAALTCMVCNFTIGKEKFKDVEEEAKNILAEASSLQHNLQKLIQADVESYSQVSSAFKLPKEAKTQCQTREKAIQKALKAAADIPLRVAESSYQILKLNQRLVDIGNPNLITDVGVAVLFAEAAIKSAALNVDINLASIKDQNFNRTTSNTLQAFITEGEKIKQQVMKKVTGKIKK